MQSKSTFPKLSVFSLAMINLAAVSSVRNWPTIAEYGLSSLFFFLLSALLFFVPVAMISAELATGWPKNGGVFVWVKEAFGHRTGFLAIWLLWAENVIYYPVLLSFIAGTLAYLIHPELANHQLYTLLVVILLFWMATLINLRGLRASSQISTYGVIIGTLIPGAFIIFLGAFWYFSGNPIEITFTLKSLIPDMSSPNQLVLFAGVLAAFGGLEMSAIYANDVEKPQKNYPKAIFLSGILIFALYVLGVLAIALVVPQKEISLVAGSLQAFSVFVQAYNLSWLTPLLAILLALGAFGTLSTWIVGPSMGLLAAAQSGDLPPFFRRLNSRGMPINLLFAQAIVVTLFSFIFLLMPTVSSAYWILNAMLTELYLVMYMLMFAAAIRLRYTKPNVPRTYKIPGGIPGMWVVGGLGLIGACSTFLIGFFPPAQLTTGNPVFYVSFLFIGVVIVCLTPSIILLFQKSSWLHPEKN